MQSRRVVKWKHEITKCAEELFFMDLNQLDMKIPGEQNIQRAFFDVISVAYTFAVSNKQRAKIICVLVKYV